MCVYWVLSDQTSKNISELVVIWRKRDRERIDVLIIFTYFDYFSTSLLKNNGQFKMLYFWFVCGNKRSLKKNNNNCLVCRFQKKKQRKRRGIKCTTWEKMLERLILFNARDSMTGPFRVQKFRYLILLLFSTDLNSLNIHRCKGITKWNKLKLSFLNSCYAKIGHVCMS